MHLDESGSWCEAKGYFSVVRYMDDRVSIFQILSGVQYL